MEVVPTVGTLEAPGVESGGAAGARLWRAVDSLVDRARRVEDLRAHRLHLLAARRLRALGEPVPAPLVEAERASATMGLLSPLVLSAVRGAFDDGIVLLKGPEVAARYPDPATRPFNDLDVLVEDAPAAHRALRAAGFVEIGDPRLYEGIHHLRPVVHPDVPIPVEVHARPKWISWHPGPESASLVRAGVPGRSGVDGISALPPAHHALVLAAHSWAHEPLRRALDLVDVAAVAGEADPAEIEELAAEWGLLRVWRTTNRLAEAALFGSPLPPAGRLWAGGIVGVRERTVLEAHLEGWLSGYSARPPLQAVASMLAAVRADLRRDHGDSWRRKLRRSSRAIGNAFRPRSHHDELLGRIGARAMPPHERDDRA